MLQGHLHQLRAEALESFFILQEVTGNLMYREWGWKIYQAIEKHCKLPANIGGYGAYNDVTSLTAGVQQHQPWHYASKTLKYMYLLQQPSDGTRLQEYVFGTGGHVYPLRKYFFRD